MELKKLLVKALVCSSVLILGSIYLFIMSITIDIENKYLKRIIFTEIPTAPPRTP